MHFCPLIFWQPTQRILIYGTPGEFLMRLQGWENPHRGGTKLGRCTRIFYTFTKYGSPAVNRHRCQKVQDMWKI